MYYNEAKKNKTETQIKERKVRSNENLTFYPIQTKYGRYRLRRSWCLLHL